MKNLFFYGFALISLSSSLGLMLWSGSWALIDGAALEKAAYYNIEQGKSMSERDLIHHNHRELAHRINAGLEEVWFLQAMGVAVSSLTLIQLTWLVKAIEKNAENKKEEESKQ